MADGLREQDLNLRPPGYEPDELPDCSIAAMLEHYHSAPDKEKPAKHLCGRAK